MFKKLFKTKEEFINFLYSHKPWKIGTTITVDKINDFAPQLGIDFLSKYDVTGNIKDDGKWAGKEHYIWNKSRGNLPKRFPVVMVLDVYQIKYDNLYNIEYVYLNDFK